MSDTPKTNRADYFARADSWANDRLAAAHRARRVGWWVAAGASVIAVCEALALFALMPLKRVEPYTLLVDRQTGYVQLLKPLEPQLIASRAALTQSFLVQYAIAREGFDIDAVQDSYRKVAAWSAGTARNEYLGQMSGSNPESPLARYPRTTTIGVTVKSVSPLGDHAALVRFDTSRHDAGQQSQPGRPWAAVVRYDYVNKPMSAADRFINPLGFQVLRYSRSPEALAPPGPTPASETQSPTAPAPIAPAPFRTSSGSYRP